MERTDNILLTVVLALGALKLLHLVWQTAMAVWKVFLRPGRDLKHYGKWAVVTGATDGIGLAQVKALAAREINVVLIGRNPQKLEDCVKEIGAIHRRVQLMTIVCDFAKATEKEYKEIRTTLEELEVGILINNAGVSYPYPEYLTDIDQELVDNLIRVNTIAVTEMTRIVLPAMMKRRKGAIVNIGSAAGHIPVGDPLLTVYSATKAYVNFFSRSLHHELKSVGIDVQCQIPYFVTSKMSRMRRPTLTVPSAEAFAESSLRVIGFEPVVVPYWSHYLQDLLLSSLPIMISSWIVLRHHRDVRKRALKKKAEQTAEQKEQ